MTTLCGRPTRDNAGIYSTHDFTYGDSNYGYVDRCTPMGSCSIQLPNGSSASILTKFNQPVVCNVSVDQNIPQPQPSNANTITTPACSFYGACSWNGNQPAYSYLCQSNWDAPAYTTYKVNCCAGLASTSNACTPEACPAAVDKTDDNGCQTAMADFCTSANWTNNAVTYPPGSGNVIDGELACDTYLKTVPQVGTVGIDSSHPTFNAAQDIIHNAVSQFYTTNEPSSTDPTAQKFIQKAINWCYQYPGTCDDILKNVCSSYTRADLQDNQLLQQTCGCFLPDDEYYLDPSSNITASCDSLCAYPGTIPIGATTNGVFTGGAQVCGGTTCVIDNVTVDMLNSDAGKITFSQMCNQCSLGPCRCIFGNVTVNSINSTYAGAQVADKCGSCFTIGPNDTLTPVDCGSIPVPGGQPVEETGFSDWVAKHAVTIGAILIAIAVALIILLVIFWYIK